MVLPRKNMVIVEHTSNKQVADYSFGSKCMANDHSVFIQDAQSNVSLGRVMPL